MLTITRLANVTVIMIDISAAQLSKLPPKIYSQNRELCVDYNINAIFIIAKT